MKSTFTGFKASFKAMCSFAPNIVAQAIEEQANATLLVLGTGAANDWVSCSPLRKSVFAGRKL